MVIKSHHFVMSKLEQKRKQFIFADEIHDWGTGLQTPEPCLQPANIPCHVPVGNICTEDQPGQRSPSLRVGFD